MNESPKSKSRVSVQTSKLGNRRQSEKRRDDILDAALDLFASRGYAATTIDAIAKNANVSKGLVLFHFESKEGVFKAVVTRAIPPLLRKFENFDENDKRSASDILRDTLRQAYRDIVEQPASKAILTLLVAEGARFPTLVAFHHSQVVQRGQEVFRRIVDLGVKRGEFTVPASENVTKVLMAPVIGALVWNILYSHIEPLSLEPLIDVHVDMSLMGLTRSSGT